MKFSWTALLFLSLALYTCRTDENLVCTDKNTRKVCKAARDYFYFKTGSWWVYREQLTGITDSIWVSFDEDAKENLPTHSKRVCHCGWGECEESLLVHFENLVHNKNDSEYIFAYVIGASSGDTKSYAEEFNGAPEYLYIEMTRAIFDEDGKIEPMDIDNHHNEELNNLTVLGKNYRSVLHSFYTTTEHEGDWLFEAWYARNYNLVKFRNSKGTWELEKCHIVQ